MVHYSDFGMPLVYSREEVEYERCLTELVRCLVDAAEVPDRVDAILWCGDTVKRRDCFLARHYYRARDINFNAWFWEHTEPRRCLVVNWHDVEVFYVPAGRRAEVYLL